MPEDGEHDRKYVAYIEETITIFEGVVFPLCF